MANKFFGSSDAVGKMLKVNNGDLYAVTGVFKDLPENVSFKADWLAPFKIYEEKNTWLQQWGNNGVMTVAEVQPSADISAINKKLHNFVSDKQEGVNAKFSIYPMTKLHLYNSFTNGVEDNNGRIKYVRLFTIIAWIILLIACINFMNLATARSEKRAREVGVRKVLGAGKSKLVTQFMGESIVMSFLSALLAIGFIFSLLPLFNGLVEKHMSVHLFQPSHIGSLLVIALICGLVAGTYPAFFLSSFRPVLVLKGLKISQGANAGLIRKGLVIVQFSISVILIISTIIIYQQIQHVKNRDLGYNKQSLIYTNLNGKMREHFGVIKSDLLQTGVVENASLSNSYILQLGSNTGGFGWEGKDPNKQVLITIEGVSPEYVKTMGMRLKAGRDFYTDAKSDSNNIIINEALAKLLGKKDVIGSIISNDGQKYTVVGVIHDFLYNNMYTESAPLILYSDTSNTNFLTVRFKQNADVKEAITKVEKVIKANNPAYPFEYKFVDEQFDRLFKTESLIGKLAAIFAILAILISSLGLFGLSAYTAERRTKEIGIRKVLGASVGGITTLLSKDFLKLVVISFVIAFPLAGYFMYQWLQDFAYRISISWIVFVMAGLIAIVIALATISFQAVKAAVANPAKSLRTE
jgi:predicted permease